MSLAEDAAMADATSFNYSTYTPYVQLSTWRERADLFEYHIVINNQQITRVQRENVDFFDQAFSINAEDCLDKRFQYVPLPFKIEVFAVEDPRGLVNIRFHSSGSFANQRIQSQHCRISKFRKEIPI
jgi:hypothetical protein